MERGSGNLKEVVVTDEKERKEAGLVKINPKDAINIPTPTGGIESLIKIFVGSNNELTSQYTVRGGNYDENLIYVNDFEVFRPYLVSNAQQEGLSFINPEMTKSVSFYNGGFQAKYGDKMSSVLDIQYKKPSDLEARPISVCWNRDLNWKVVPPIINSPILSVRATGATRIC